MFGFSYSTPASIPDPPLPDTMTRRSKPSTASDPIEQDTATQPMSQSEPIEEYKTAGYLENRRSYYHDSAGACGC